MSSQMHVAITFQRFDCNSSFCRSWSCLHYHYILQIIAFCFALPFSLLAVIVIAFVHLQFQVFIVFDFAYSVQHFVCTVFSVRPEVYRHLSCNISDFTRGNLRQCYCLYSWKFIAALIPSGVHRCRRKYMIDTFRPQ